MTSLHEESYNLGIKHGTEWEKLRSREQMQQQCQSAYDHGFVDGKASAVDEAAKIPVYADDNDYRDGYDTGYRDGRDSLDIGSIEGEAYDRGFEAAKALYDKPTREPTVVNAISYFTVIRLIKNLNESNLKAAKNFVDEWASKHGGISMARTKDGYSVRVIDTGMLDDLLADALRKFGQNGCKFIGQS